MTQEEFENRLAKIKAQENDEIKIELYPIDKDHLDCIWYGGEVGRIKYKDWTFIIGAYGDVRMYIPDEDMTIRDRDETNYIVYDALGDRYTDDDLFKLIDDGKIDLIDSNFFVIDLKTPDGEHFDLSEWDNYLENNLLDNFDCVEGYFHYIDDAIEYINKIGECR